MLKKCFRDSHNKLSCKISAHLQQIIAFFYYGSYVDTYHWSMVKVLPTQNFIFWPILKHFSLKLWLLLYWYGPLTAWFLGKCCQQLWNFFISFWSFKASCWRSLTFKLCINFDLIMYSFDCGFRDLYNSQYSCLIIVFCCLHYSYLIKSQLARRLP